MSVEDQKDLIRAAAEQSLENFIRLVHKGRVLGAVHVELIDWWEREDKASHDLTLLPRDHQKSALLGYRVAHRIVKDPAVRILYISSTTNLASKQLKFIKDILTSPIVKFYWPDLIEEDEGKREKWTESEISVDHPKRKAEYIRDPTVFVAGLTTNVAGMHCDVIAMDDVVVQGNAYTEEGRSKTAQLYSLLASVEGSKSEGWVVGTRYHPKDLYGQMAAMRIDQYDASGEMIESKALYDIFERQVESSGDGNGEFLWPVQTRYDGKEFGFNSAILAKKRAQYHGQLVQFRAQYYNNPNDPDGAGLTATAFQYYDRAFLKRQEGKWYFKDRRLNVFASIDFAFSLEKAADYSAIVVVGVDSSHNYFVMDIARFKTDAIREYFLQILQLHRKWDFRKLRCEVTAAQDVIVKELKNNYIRKHGLALSLEDYRPTRQEGTKKERVKNILLPKYNDKQIWHYQGGHCQTLEEELLLSNPPHDDIKDALASCIDTCVPPSKLFTNSFTKAVQATVYNRFGGVN